MSVKAFVVSTPAAAHLLLWQALERQADWIADYISIPRSDPVRKKYLEWLFERLKDRVPQEASEQDLDELVRAEVKSIYSKFRDRRSGLPLRGDYADAEAHKFGEIVQNDARDCLEQLPKQMRDLLEDLYSSGPKHTTRAELAKKLGIKRNTLNQRICRAIKTIRSRLERGPAP